MKQEEPISEAASETFERHRSLLFSISYRMLGSVMEAEDVVQEAFLRWQGASERSVLPSPTSRRSLRDSR